jgi:hypothetical protein
MTRPLASCALLAMALSAHFAAAQTGTIEVDTDGVGGASWDWNPATEKWEILLVGAGQCSVTFTITATSGINPIDFIKIVSNDGTGCGGASTADVTVVEGAGAIPSIRDIIKLDGNSNAEARIMNVNISGYIGDPSDPHGHFIYGDIVSRVEATQGIYADVIAGPATNGGNSNVVTLAASGGSILGDIYAHYGWIGTVSATGGLGASGDTVQVQARDGIQQVTCAYAYSNINADVDADGTGAIRLVKTTAGDYTGTIYADAFDSSPPYENYGVHAAGDINGWVLAKRWFGRNVVIGASGWSGVLPADSTVLAGFNLGSWNSTDGFVGGVRFYDDDALQGQIVVNAQLEPNMHWVAPVIIGTNNSSTEITLDPIPYYDNKSSTFGGGAVGEVPYYCHYADCSPIGHKIDEASDGLDGLGECEDGYHALKKVAPGGQWNTVQIMHYGRIEQVGTGKPFTVRRKSIASLCGWSDVTSSFTHTMHPGGQKRMIQIDGPFAPAYDYLIEPVRSGSDRLRCDDTIASDVPVYEWDYRLRVVELQDITLNGLLQPDDISAWVAAPEDTTLDGVTDTADLVDVTEAVAESGDW